MPTLPITENSPLLRTDFSDPDSWADIKAAIVRPNEDDFRAYVDFIDDPTFQDLSTGQVLALVTPEFAKYQPCLFIVDKMTVTSAEHPILAVDLWDDRGREFRVIPSELYQVENNLSMINMDFSEFADVADSTAGGVFRGF